ncbi:Lrp/AsnC family transcriptional regulator [Kribbella deserti]|uniref:Lrp/AsnC family transcriptional regulator n=1 Tax=Kribbella deserti TaxID=1926257 RepID=A0ABV6QDB1_9ACTN
MDATDRRLLDALRENGRASWAELGRTVGLSGPSVQERVRRLEERGIVLGYRAVVAPERVGLGTSALVGLFQRDDAETDDVVAGVRAIPAVEDCWFVAGDEELVVKVRVADVAQLEAVVGSLRRVQGVVRTRTTVVLSTRWEARPAPLPDSPKE